ncbi:RmlC-like cupin domain-containing protein [Mycena alexandri]|uniref:RmlC-like cupin domain-containing protein n=1 Tax=Mycena alexandri TaxID=1745969 RepID=A0AAD6SIZ9_9AGAR|nr:RmlC-like cupin domain-containing protein [Mycena alexandri]KAJ7028909.1 RmlC-like cupin domain-containing protein [Mycena alexandri]
MLSSLFVLTALLSTVFSTPLSDLVGELRLDPTQVDRINTLSDDTQYVYDFFNPTVGIVTGAAGHTVTATSGTFPAVIGNGVAMTVGFLGPCAMNSPHTHPRAAEINFSVNGTLRTGMLAENGARFVVNELPPGSMTVFPQGAIHFEQNIGCEPAMFVAAFNGEDPGVLQMAQRFLGLPVDIISATLNGLGIVEIEGLAQMIPDNIVAGTDECLARCGLTRPVQPTLQQQPRVSGNAYPTVTGSAPPTSSSQSAPAQSQSAPAQSQSAPAQSQSAPAQSQSQSAPPQCSTPSTVLHSF